MCGLSDAFIWKGGKGVGCGHMLGGSHPSDPLTVTEDKLLFSFHVDCPQKRKGEMLCIKT